jgi:hypothetical protein
MHGIKGFILSFAAMNGLGIAALVAQTSTPHKFPSARISMSSAYAFFRTAKNEILPARRRQHSPGRA